MLLSYMNILADVYAIVDNIGSHLVALKLADVIALHLYFFVADVIALVADGITT